MKILVINAGSSSLKFTLFRMTKEEVMAKGIVERIGLERPHLKYECTQDPSRSLEKDIAVKNHSDALQIVCDTLIDKDHGVLSNLNEVQAIGHRVVHGGEQITQATLVNEQVKNTIAACASLAPLHNPPNLGGILACEKVFPNLPNVAVFDTAFHQTMPPSSYLYAIPYELYEKEGIRKYGFHGTSHHFVAQATANFLQKDPKNLKLITCHLGNGASIAAIDGMRVVDTSMGMTPLAGLMMGTRCGDIDPGVVLHLIKSGHSADEVDKILNKQSGLLAIAGIGSSDMRDILKAVQENHQRAIQAFEMFVYRVAFYIGAYYVALNGADAVVFTGGIGENSIPTRAAIVKRIESLGCELDPQANESKVQPKIISSARSRLKVIVVPTNEELMIARETKRIYETHFKK